MSSLNDPLVVEVFKAMVVHRPQLAALADLGDDEEEVDIRLLGDQLIRNFPWPIGIEVRRLLSGSMREPDRRRLDQLFRTFERSVQFLAFVMVSQLWRTRKERPFPLPASFTNEFQRRAPLVSLGNLTWMVRQGARVWKGGGDQWFVKELGALVTDRFCDELDAWVPERNEMGHYQVNLTLEEVQRRCVSANGRIILLLSRLAFFANYRLLAAREDRRSGSANSGTSAVWLVKGGRDPEGYLDLSPLVIDAGGVRKDGPMDLSFRKDGFLFSKYRDGEIFYSGSEATERTDLRGLSDYGGLVAAFEDMMAALTRMS